MIRLDQISKQHGPQILFVDASAAIFRGEKIGLVGPNGAGKSTIFRMIMREESPDDGQVSIERGITIGYFSQDVGEMAGRPVVAETMAGAGAGLGGRRRAASSWRRRSPTPRNGRRDGRAARALRRRCRRGSTSSGGYALEARAREILAGLGFSQEMMDGDVGAAVGRLEDARGPGAHSARCAPTPCCSTSRRTTWTSSR